MSAGGSPVAQQANPPLVVPASYMGAELTRALAAPLPVQLPVYELEKQPLCPRVRPGGSFWFGSAQLWHRGHLGSDPSNGKFSLFLLPSM